MSSAIAGRRYNTRVNDNELLRYSRHILLPALGIDGQQRLRAAHVAIIGIGGLGSPAAMYLAASGIGQLTLVDDDRVELSNLQRQIAHTTADIGQPKVESARRMLAALNPDVDIAIHARRLEDAELVTLARAATVVLDASDNFATRFAINAACLAARTPLVSAATIRLEAQITVFDFRRADSPCYRCLYPGTEELAETCSETGVLAPLPGIFGAMQATEALKLIAGFGESLMGRLLLLDAARMEWRCVKLRKDPQCPACGTRGA